MRFIPGQPGIIVQNMEGAAGVVAANYLARRVAPDGLTLAVPGRSWFLETRSVASKAAVVDPTPDGAIGYDANASHQFDKWRHASKRGNKVPVSFNMLFCDGHVGEITSIEDAFKSMRLKFPL